MQDYPIIIGDHALERLSPLIQQHNPSQIMVFADTHTHMFCYPIFKEFLPSHELYVIPPGEIHKKLSTCQKMWEVLTQKGFDRKALVINLGGGVLGDMGGFVAATYKRGISFIQIPTTLLSQVDASVGGKLGIDFHALKNHIGIFQNPEAVLIYPPFLNTLPKEELISGFAEVVKHHLIADATAWKQLMKHSDLGACDFPALIQHSVNIKSQIVNMDYKESGARKALNFGHTIGHAIESLHMEEPSLKHLLHGEAIAIGMIAESYISYKKENLALADLESISEYLLRFFPKVALEKGFYDSIYRRMLQDKKNEHGGIMTTLIPEIGSFQVNVAIQKPIIMEALDYYKGL